MNERSNDWGAKQRPKPPYLTPEPLLVRDFKGDVLPRQSRAELPRLESRDIGAGPRAGTGVLNVNTGAEAVFFHKLRPTRSLIHIEVSVSMKFHFTPTSLNALASSGRFVM